MDMIYAHTDQEHHQRYAELIGRALFSPKKPAGTESVQRTFAMGAD